MRAMKLAIVVAIALALVGCSEKKGPDLKKMEPEEACAEIGKRMSACKPQIVEAVKKSGKLADDELGHFEKALDANAMRCEGMERGMIDRIADCYSTSCDKFAACMMSTALGASLEPGGSPEHL